MWYEVFAFARSAHPPAEVSRPLVRPFERRFATEFLRGMAAAVEGGSDDRSRGLRGLFIPPQPPPLGAA